MKRDRNYLLTKTTQKFKTYIHYCFYSPSYPYLIPSSCTIFIYPYKDDDDHQDKHRSTSSIFSSRPTNLHQFNFFICDEEIFDNRRGVEQVEKEDNASNKKINYWN